MPSQFAQYQQGITPVQGIADAGFNIGKFSQQGLSSLGANIADGLQTYNENKSMNDFLDEKAKVLAQQVIQFHNMYANNPEMRDFSDSLNPYIETLSKTSGMSLSAKKGAIAEVEHGFSNIGTQLQAFMQNKDMMLRQAIGAAGQSVKQTTTESVPAIVDKALNNWDFNKTPTQNRAAFQSVLEGMKANGAQIDVADILDKWTQAAPTRLQQAKVDSLGRPINPDIISATVKQLQNEQALNTGSYTSNSDYLEKEHALDESVSSDVISQLNEKAKSDKQSAVNFAPDWLIEKAKKEKALASTQSSKMAKAGSDILSDTLSWGLEQAKQGNPITLNDIGRKLYNQELQKNPTAYEAPRPNAWLGLGAGGMGMEGGLVAPTRPSFVEPTPATPAFESIAAKLGINKDKNLSANDILALQKALAPKVDEFKQSAEKMAETAKNIAAGAEPEKPAYSQAPVTMGQANVGMRTVESPYVDFEKQKRDTAAFVAARMGYKDSNGNTVIPAGFEEAFAKLHPESSLKVVNTPYGAMMWNGKDWTQLKQQKMSVEDLRKNARGVYGVETENGFAMAPAFAGSRIQLAGLFTGSDEELKDFKTKIRSTEQVMDASKTLNEILDSPFHSLNPTLIGRAKEAAATLSSALQPTLFPHARFTAWEQKIIDDVKADPSSLLRLDSTDRERLKNLYARAVKSIQMEAGTNGLAFRITDSNSPEQIVQEARNAKLGIK